MSQMPSEMRKNCRSKIDRQFLLESEWKIDVAEGAVRADKSRQNGIGKEISRET